MSSSEKPSAKILISVASGLILAVLLYIGRNLIPSVFRWIGGVFAAGWNWFVSAHSVPGWLLVLLTFCGIWFILRLIAELRTPPQPAEPQWHDFTEFHFLGVLWRWRYYGSEIHSLVSFCPQTGCDMQTYGSGGQYYNPGRETTVYRCDRCGHMPEVQGTKEQIENKVMREIQRLLRCGDWKKHIRQPA